MRGMYINAASSRFLECPSFSCHLFQPDYWLNRLNNKRLLIQDSAAPWAHEQ